MRDARSLLQQLWMTGVAAVSGQHAVAEALKAEEAFPASLLIAAGKAACSMFKGAESCISPSTRSIIVSKHGHICRGLMGRPSMEIIEAGHPLPDENSLIAGERILQMVAEAVADDRLLLLISGGASATVEALQPGLDLDELRAVTGDLLASGKSIREINEVRARMSRVKGGRLLGEFRGSEARVYALSDVRGDDLATIGGGLGDPSRASAAVSARLVASNAAARDAAAQEAERLGLPVRLNEESLYRDVGVLADEISATLARGAAGIYVWGGEPVIELPPDPGTGGRNQSLALAIARNIRGNERVSLLVAGTDGTDGPTAYAGAFVDGSTVDDADEAEDALRRADAGSYLAGRNCLFKPGPTDTNVMDLVIAAVSGDVGGADLGLPDRR